MEWLLWSLMSMYFSGYGCLHLLPIYKSWCQTVFIFLWNHANLMCIIFGGFVFVWGRVSICTLDCPGTQYIYIYISAGFELEEILLPLLSKCWNWRQMPPSLAMCYILMVTICRYNIQKFNNPTTYIKLFTLGNYILEFVLFLFSCNWWENWSANKLINWNSVAKLVHGWDKILQPNYLREMHF